MEKILAMRSDDDALPADGDRTGSIAGVRAAVSAVVRGATPNLGAQAARIGAILDSAFAVRP